MKPLEALKYHVTGAIERGEKSAIISKPMINSFDEWSKAVGVLNPQRLYCLKILPKGMVHDCGGIEANWQTNNILVKFIRENPKYHIATYVETDSGALYANNYHYVNRMHYYLCDGSTEDCTFRDYYRED